MFSDDSWEALTTALLGPAPRLSLQEQFAAHLPSSRDVRAVRPTPRAVLWCDWQDDLLLLGLSLPLDTLLRGPHVYPTPPRDAKGIIHSVLSVLDLAETPPDNLCELFVPLDTPGQGLILPLPFHIYMLCEPTFIGPCHQWRHLSPTQEDGRRVSLQSDVRLDAHGQLHFMRTIERSTSLIGPSGTLEHVRTYALQTADALRHIVAHLPTHPRELPIGKELLDTLWRDLIALETPMPREAHLAIPKASTNLVTHWWHGLTNPRIRAHHGGGSSRTTKEDFSLFHFSLRALLLPMWHSFALDIVEAHLRTKQRIVRGSQNSTARRESLKSRHALGALLLIHALPRHASIEAWFDKRNNVSIQAIIPDTFEDISPEHRPIYFTYALALLLEARGFEEPLVIDQQGVPAPRRWAIEDPTRPEGERLWFDHPAFTEALQQVLKRHIWRPEDVPKWVFGVIERRLEVGDLEVAPLMPWHPQVDQVMARICGQSSRRTRWLLSWLKHHPRVSPLFCAPMLRLEADQIAELDGFELTLLYQHLELAPSALRQQHKECVQLIVARAVVTLGSDAFDNLDAILKDAASADIMAHISTLIEQLPLLSAKRRVLKREQKQLLAQVDLAAFAGQLSLHQGAPDQRGALSHVEGDGGSLTLHDPENS